MQEQKKNRYGLLVRIGVALIACALVFKDLDIRQTGVTFAKIPIWIPFIVIGTFILSQIILAFRWWLFMRAWGIHLDYKMAIKLTFLGVYFNNFLPGSVGGDLVRAWYVAHHTNKRMASVISVFVDRVLALMSTLIMAMAAFFLAGPKDFVIRQESSGIIGDISKHKWFIFSAIAVVVVMFIFILLIPAGRKIFKPIYDRVLHHGNNAIHQLFQAGMVFLKNPFLGPTAITLTLVLQSMVIVSLWMIGKQINIPANIEIYFVILPMMWVVGSIPISIAGIGIVEGGMIVLFQKFGGASINEAAALALSQRAVWILASMPGLIIHLTGKHLPKDLQSHFSIDGKDGMQ